MNHRFWTSRWKQNDIGFHKQQPHFALTKYFSRLNLRPGDTIFVPLCGKSLDMRWLAERGIHVVGTELSRLAVEAFFAENGLAPVQQDSGAFNRYSADGLEIMCGDHFNLQSDDLKGVAAAYDRAALVALPPDLRRRYADQLSRLLPPETHILLVSYDYKQDEISGPPFAVPFSEIEDLFGLKFEIELLEQKNALDSHQGLKARGVSMLTEFICLLTRRADC